MRRYTVVVFKEDGAYTVRVPAPPGCHTWGSTFDGALANAREAIELYLSVLRDEGEPIPADVDAPTVTSVEVAA